MSTSITIKRIFKKSIFLLNIIPSILLVLGIIFIFCFNNFTSFIFTLILPILLGLNIVTCFYWLFKKDKFLFISLFCILLYFFCFDSFFQWHKTTINQLNKTTSSTEIFSLLTLNTDGFRTVASEKNRIVDFIKKENPDVFCVQEFSAIQFKYFTSTHPYWYKTNVVRTGKSIMAVFSKYPIVDKGYINFPDTSNGAMFVDLDFNEEIIRIYNVHFESFKAPVAHYNFWDPTVYSILKSKISKAEIKKVNQVEIVKKHKANFKGKIILCGDFNSTPFSVTYSSIKVLNKDTFVESGCGLGTTYKLFNYPFRLDYVLVDESIEVLSHQNFDIKISDHEPILVKLLIR